MKLGERLIVIRGAGEMASGVAWRLFQSHFKVLLMEIPQPLAVRRMVSFCEAVYEGRQTVEGGGGGTDPGRQPGGIGGSPC